MAAIVTFSFLLCSNTFHILRPAKAPGFAYAWLELISHRVFIGRMLALTPQQKVHCDFIFDTISTGDQKTIPFYLYAHHTLFSTTQTLLLYL